MASIVCMGEIMLRLTTPGYQRFAQAQSFEACYGGSEASVAVSAANYGHKAEFVTRLPANPLGDSAVAALRARNVGTQFIARGGDRIGIYFLENGASVRPSNIVYDRTNSAIATAKENDFDFPNIFHGVDWFHFTGITPALSDTALTLTESALKAAKDANITISVDLNYRKKMWSIERAQQVMSHLMQYVDVCIGNEEDAEKVLGFKAEGSDVIRGEFDFNGYESVCRQMVEKYHFKYVLSSLRESRSASDNGWSACIFSRDDGIFYHSRQYNIHIVDRVGGGDAFAGGFMSCILDDPENYKGALDFAVAASALKQTIPGDFNFAIKSEVEALVCGDTSGRVQR